jgi:hypothetical protein
MRKTMMVAAAGLLVAVLAGCGPQPGSYGPGYGYGSSPAYGYGPAPAYGYGPQYGYSQPAPNPLAQLLGGLMQPSSGYSSQPYYSPQPYYGSRYGLQ